MVLFAQLQKSWITWGRRIHPELAGFATFAMMAGFIAITSEFAGAQQRGQQVVAKSLAELKESAIAGVEISAELGARGRSGRPSAACRSRVGVIGG